MSRRVRCSVLHTRMSGHAAGFREKPPVFVVVPLCLKVKSGLSGRVCPSLPAADANNRLQPDYRSVSLLDSSFTSFNSIMGNGILFAVELPSLPLANLPLGSKGTLPKSRLDPPEGEVTTL